MSYRSGASRLKIEWPEPIDRHRSVRDRGTGHQRPANAPEQLEKAIDDIFGQGGILTQQDVAQRERTLPNRLNLSDQDDRGRTLSDLLHAQSAEQGGRRHLCQLFPDGPVLQGREIAGLQIPTYSTGPSSPSTRNPVTAAATLIISPTTRARRLRRQAILA